MSIRRNHPMADRLAIYRQIDRFDPFASFERKPAMIPRIDLSTGRPRLTLVDECGTQRVYTMEEEDLCQLQRSIILAQKTLNAAWQDQIAAREEDQIQVP
jgi:hypothetical protein